MKTPLYLFEACKIARKDNTLQITVFAPKDEDELHPGERLGKTEQEELALQEDDAWWYGTPRIIPVERIDAILCFTHVNFNSSLVHFLAEKAIPVHFFNYYGSYTSSLIHEAPNENGKVLVAQVQSYQETSKRVELSRRIIKGAIHNMNRLIAYYQSRNQELPLQTMDLKRLERQLDFMTSIEGIMGVEGQVRAGFYQELDKILMANLRILERTYHPPRNPANALLSFLNSLLYAQVMQEIIKTPLNPTIGVLHEAGRQRYPLVYDLTEIFRPLVSEQLLVSLIRKRIVKEEDFEESLNGALLTKDGRYKVARVFEQRLRTTIQHPTLKRNVSYRTLIRLEAYKIIKHLLNQQEYEPFTLNW
jgi:CRISPR-associated protein Cas1